MWDGKGCITFWVKMKKTQRNLYLLSLKTSLWKRSRTFFRTVYPSKNHVTTHPGNRSFYLYLKLMIHSYILQDDLVRSYIEEYHLNQDQAEAIKRVGSMFSLEKSDSYDSILLVHGKAK